MRTVIAILSFWLVTLPATPAIAQDASDPSLRGRYLVSLLACGRCHTEGYLTGNMATGPELAGSTIGIAYTAYSEDELNPGVVFAGNLTGDDETGLGSWTEGDIIRAMTMGISRNGHERLNVMPWPNYNALSPDDLTVVARYLKTLPPVRRDIPDSIAEGEAINRPYVRFGVYQFQPHTPPPAAPGGLTVD